MGGFFGGLYFFFETGGGGSFTALGVGGSFLISCFLLLI